MRRAVVIGSNGPPGDRQLEFAEKDARDVIRTLSGLVCGFEVEKAVGLKASSARTRFLRACEACSEDDTLVAYFVGHGLINEGDLFFLFSNTDYSRLMETCLRGDEVLTALRRCKASNRVLVLDCCNAGQITGKSGIRSGRADRVLMKDLGFVSDIFEIILASDALESAREFESLGGGFLSTSLVRALSVNRIEADADGDGAISVHDMETWLRGQAVDYNRRQDQHADRVPLPRRVGAGQGTTFLSRPTGDWLYYEVPFPDGIPGVVLPVYPFEGTHAYVIGKYPVTVAAYLRSREGWPGPRARRFDGRQWEQRVFDVLRDEEFGHPTKPVVGISLKDALSHCQWLQEHGRSLVRVIAPPTPALWEIALLGNSRRREHVDWLRVQPKAHSKATSTARCDNAIDRTNSLGIVDLIGNVWEWCIDEYEWRWFTYGQSSMVRRPRQTIIEPTLSTVRTEYSSMDVQRPKAWLKGGGFYDDLEEIELTVDADDIAGGPDSSHVDVGFRWSALVPLSRLPAEVRELLEVAPPLPSRSRRRMAVTA
ncbi:MULTISPECIES: SUMF1/EgtB/PvdO family nonheme iron enzyme [Rhizobium]|uniref:SUMF1/EgtB/PvdO family nonheme iron enzyme n=1 Tax=Rhizobium TaxID=379 RepID=UPI001C911AB9|nr:MULTISPECIES: SUMF1/EgtB/PvdO family nonheme iron enzyme [Rhizobium]MBY3316608.1 SUMF1/EgtB/PvdO family nonheme iron enzyme [Rhizobium laguerreae]MBY5369571.1 SUMF1/EgtB/PvdO family nonheme iron enzyme [Rhizobium leguminosarum]MBY5452225.1 SUMF1/EgtB/PvdO family nonheme iron enzyme [Rhizobium leguminosarum]